MEAAGSIAMLSPIYQSALYHPRRLPSYNSLWGEAQVNTDYY